VLYPNVRKKFLELHNFSIYCIFTRNFLYHGEHIRAHVGEHETF